jgi:hypothetical protein
MGYSAGSKSAYFRWLTLTRNEDTGYSGLCPCYGNRRDRWRSPSQTVTDEMNKSRVVGKQEIENPGPVNLRFARHPSQWRPQANRVANTRAIHQRVFTSEKGESPLLASG